MGVVPGGMFAEVRGEAGCGSGCLGADAGAVCIAALCCCCSGALQCVFSCWFLTDVSAC